MLIYFRHDIWRIASMWLQSLVQAGVPRPLRRRMGWFIIIGSLPIVILGIALKDVIEEDFRSLWIIGTTLIVLGIVLGIADQVSRSNKTIKNMAPARRDPDGPRPGAAR